VSHIMRMSRGGRGDAGVAASGLAGYLSFPPLRVTCVHFSVSDHAASESELVARCPTTVCHLVPSGVDLYL